VRRGAGGSVTAPGALAWLLAWLVAALVLIPVVWVVLRAAAADRDIWRLVADPRTLRLLANTLLLALAVTAAAVILAVPMAWLTTRSDLPGRRFWTVALAVPLAVPSYLGAYTIIAALGPRGMLQQLAGRFLGLERLPDLYGFGGAALALTLFSYPYVYLTVRGALLRADPALEEASRSLGHGPLATFLRVVLPNLRPAIASGALLVALYVFSDFGAVSFMQFETFTRAIYTQYLAAFDRTYGAVLSLLLVACTALVLAGEAWTRGRARHDRVGPGLQRTPAVVSLGRWRVPALIFCGMVTFLGIGLPLIVVFYWLFLGADPLGWSLARQALGNSLLAGALAAVATVLMALPVARVAARSPSPWARVVESASYVGYALPGVVVALGLVFFGIHAAWPLYQTLTMLIFGYVVLFLPQAVGALRSSFLQINPHLEEAARTLGAGSGRTLRTVTLPLLGPGAAAAAALVFLTTIKELPATLLLGPTGFRTLATVVWSTTSEVFYGRAAPAALVLMMVSFLSVAFLLADARPGALRAPWTARRGRRRHDAAGGDGGLVPRRAQAV